MPGYMIKHKKRSNVISTFIPTSSIVDSTKIILEIESFIEEETNPKKAEILSSFSQNSTISEQSWHFLHGLASSKTFRNNIWHKKPILLRSSTLLQPWLRHAFEANDLKLVENSYISGHMTSEVLRNGTNTKTWEFTPIKPDPSKPTTYFQIQEALKGGTIYFNTAGSLWPKVGAICRMSNAAFGIPSNVNIYISPPNITLSVPPHTDKQDVLVCQTCGQKHWKVYAPPKRQKGIDPMARGKNKDSLRKELNNVKPILEVILQPGDVLYVPHGFPHTTDTISYNETAAETDAQDDISIHLTLGLDTHVWFLTFAHVRWVLLQKEKMEFKVDIETDELFWNSMDSIPIGFLFESNDQFKIRFIQIMQDLEPTRFQNGANLPSDSAFQEVIDYMKIHTQKLLGVQERMYSNINPHDYDSTIIKAYEGTQEQNLILEELFRFCGNDIMAGNYERMRKQRETAALNAMKSVMNS